MEPFPMRVAAAVGIHGASPMVPTSASSPSAAALRGGAAPGGAGAGAAGAWAPQPLRDWAAAAGEVVYAPPPPHRATSVSWWSDTLSETDSFTEYTLDSEETSLSSTRAPTSAASGSVSRISAGSRRRGFSMGAVRGARSPVTGYRGRSVTRRDRRGMPGAALRHRHPTHTPSRGPAGRGGAGASVDSALGAAAFAASPSMVAAASAAVAASMAPRLGGRALGPGGFAASGLIHGMGSAIIGPPAMYRAEAQGAPHRFHQIGRVREERPADFGAL